MHGINRREKMGRTREGGVCGTYLGFSRLTPSLPLLVKLREGRFVLILAICGSRYMRPQTLPQSRGAYHARVAFDDAHDGGKTLPAQRAAAPLIPQHGRALDAELAMAALEQDGVGGALHAHEALIVTIAV